MAQVETNGKAAFALVNWEFGMAVILDGGHGSGLGLKGRHVFIWTAVKAKCFTDGSIEFVTRIAGDKVYVVAPIAHANRGALSS